MENSIKIALIACILFACKTAYQKPEKSFPRMEIGEGGGFTGAFQSYVLLQDGRVFFKSTFADTGIFYVNLDKKSAKKYLAEAKKLAVVRMPVKEPDNIYRTLRYIQKDTFYEAVWYERRPEYDSLYNQLYDEIQRRHLIRR